MIAIFMLGVSLGLVLSLLIDMFQQDIRQMIRREAALAAIALQQREEEKS